MLAVLACAELPDPIRSVIACAGIDAAGYQRLVLVGNSGGRFWDALERVAGCVSTAESDHPIDEFSRLQIENAVKAHWGGAAVAVLYPGEPALPLQRLGRVAGWQHD